tara:strand:- start:4198 stop:5040 length:843 start_codon:yes stop_codon:yes gene_type:complete
MAYKQIITVGHDAELFLYDEDNNAIPSIGLVGGSKECPREINGGAVQEDNVMAEINIEPCTTKRQFVNRTNEIIESLSTIIKRHGLHYKIMDFQKFKPEFLKHPQAKQFGCDPDRNIYTMKENVVDTKLLQSNNIRTAGGHIHIGLSDPDFHAMAKTSLVKGCDWYIGLPLTILEHKSERKAFYGKAGSFREKSYGIEYRTPSNIWLSSDDLKMWIFNQVQTLVRDVLYYLPNNEMPQHERNIAGLGETTFQEIINHGQADYAQDICNDFSIPIPSLEKS